MKTILAFLFIGFGLAALLSLFGASVAKQAVIKTSVVQAAILPERQRYGVYTRSKGKKPEKPKFDEPHVGPRNPSIRVVTY